MKQIRHPHHHQQPDADEQAAYESYVDARASTRHSPPRVLQSCSSGPRDRPQCTSSRCEQGVSDRLTVIQLSHTYDTRDREHGKYDDASLERGSPAHGWSSGSSRSDPSPLRSPSGCSAAPGRTCTQPSASGTDSQEPWSSGPAHGDRHLRCSEWTQQPACGQSHRSSISPPSAETCSWSQHPPRERSWSARSSKNHGPCSLHIKSTLRRKTLSRISRSNTTHRVSLPLTTRTHKTERGQNNSTTHKNSYNTKTMHKQGVYAYLYFTICL